MMNFTYAILNSSGTVANIVVADNSNADAALEALVPEAARIVLATEETGPAFVGGDFVGGAFRPPAPFPSWLWDASSGAWNPPVEYPTDDHVYAWSEDQGAWVRISNDAVPPEPNE